MRILPILFNTEMVKAILEGRKTVTRRCVKLPKWIEKQNDGTYTMFAESTCYEKQRFVDIAPYLNKPYRPGDILYVRETWNICNMDIQENAIAFIYRADESEEQSARTVIVSDEIFDKYSGDMAENNPEWRPSIHMPKAAARIFLKVKEVRVERLQEMNLDDFLDEGITIPPRSFNDPENAYGQAKDIFSALWNSTVKKSDIGVYGWDTNPWVWVVEFERCEKPKQWIERMLV